MVIRTNVSWLFFLLFIRLGGCGGFIGRCGDFVGLCGIFDGSVRRDDGFERFLRVGGVTGVFWEACVGVASYRVARTAVIDHLDLYLSITAM